MTETERKFWTGLVEQAYREGAYFGDANGFEISEAKIEMDAALARGASLDDLDRINAELDAEADFQNGEGA